MGRTNIEWATDVWNPIRGCSRVSEGCRNCYAETVARRFTGPGQPYEGLIARGGQWNGQVRLVPEKLDEPLRWRKPRRIFVNSMSDLFHHEVPLSYIARVFAIMALAKRHTFQVLTKRPERMAALLNVVGRDGFQAEMLWEANRNLGDYCTANSVAPWDWPLPNVWLGVSVEDQATADERIPLLLQTPAAVRWVSAEPLLGRVRLDHMYRSDPDGEWTYVDNALTGFQAHKAGGWYGSKLDWVVAGGESGTGARPMHPDWVRSLRDQCQAAGVPFFMKQITNERGRKIPMEDWPTDLQIQEYPYAHA